MVVPKCHIYIHIHIYIKLPQIFKGLRVYAEPLVPVAKGGGQKKKGSN